MLDPDEGSLIVISVVYGDWYESKKLSVYSCVELVVIVKFLAGYALFETIAAVRFPRTTTDFIDGWVESTMSLFPA